MTLIDERPPPPPPAPAPSEPEAPKDPSLPFVGVCLLITAVLVDLALQTRASGVAAVLAVAVLALGLATVGSVRRPVGRALLLAATGLSVFLAVRASLWLVTMDLLAIAALLALAVTSNSSTTRFGTRFGTAARRVAGTVESGITAAPVAVKALGSLVPAAPEGAGRRLWAVARGLLLAVPLLGVLGLLLASADPVFASMFSTDVDLSSAPVHAIVIGASLWIAAGWFVAARRPAVEERDSSVRIGETEGFVVVTSLTALYALFAFSRYTATRRGADEILATNGLTYAEYARSGFFQLLWVAGLTAAVLVFLRAAVELRSRAARCAFAVVSAVASLLTLVVVHAAIVGLELYSDAFGLTLLRIYSSTFAWWLGAAFVFMAVAFMGNVVWRREWLPTAVGLAALAAVVILNVVNPEAVIVDRNLDRHLGGAEFDAGYLVRLSDDATPALVDALPRLDDRNREFVLTQICADGTTSPTGWNLSRQRAADALDTACS